MTAVPATHKAMLRCLLFGIAAAAACTVGCEELAATPQTPPGRVAILAIDGASPRIVESWMAEGLLPNLARLAEEGAYGHSVAGYPLLSPRIWTTVATGKTPEKHGIASWVHSEGPRKGRMYRSYDRRGHALWNIVSERGMTVALVNWLMTQPPEKVRGVVVSEFTLARATLDDVADIFGRDTTLSPDAAERAITVWPPEWLPRVTRLVDEGLRHDDAVMDVAAAAGAHPGQRGPLIDEIQYTDDRVTRIALEIDEAIEPDLLLLWLPGIDRLSHFSWAGVEDSTAYPPGTALCSARWRDHMRRGMRLYYQYSDQLIGVLLERFGPDDLVIVLSDHGFERATDPTPETTGGHQTERARRGVFFARGPGVPAGERVGDVPMTWVTPTILAWLGLPVARDMDGKVADFMRIEGVERIETYDRGTIERVETSADQIEGHILEKLKSLGYIR
jgi:predicted AlkP superfamily phosphohydrolase/phosphomutase